MKRWKPFPTVMCALSLWLLPLHAQNICLPCYDSDSFGAFEVTADYLFWKPCFTDLDFAASGSIERVSNFSAFANGEVNYNFIDPSWSSGFRVRGCKTEIWCRWLLSLSYTRLKASASSESSPSSNILLLPNLDSQFCYDTTSAHWNTLYQTWDLLVAYPLTFNDTQTLIPTFGITGLFLNQNLNTKSFPSDDPNVARATTGWTSYYPGVGIKVALDYELSLRRCWKITAGLAGSLVAGEIDGKNSQFLTTKYLNADEKETTIHFHDDKDSHVMSSYHLLLGILYQTAICNRTVDFRVGYEFIQWFNVPVARRFFNEISDLPAENARSTRNFTGTLGFHGLFAGLNIQF